MQTHKELKSAVLLICFNRPDTTKVVFESIRKVEPKKLYVAIDGPRINKPEENDLCAQVLQITKNVDWVCDAEYLIRDKNLGCKIGVTTAISWALTNEDRIIIIEDDIVAAPAFFYFADEMLEKYKNEKEIAAVSANNYTPMEDIQNDYFFSKHGHIWGWATWKRAWEPFDVEVPYIQSDIENGHLKTLNLETQELKYFNKRAKKINDQIKNGRINTWDYQYAYYRLRNELLSIVPKVNLASNIGINSSRTNSKSKTNTNYYPAITDFIVQNHPDKVECNLIYDRHHFKAHINKKAPFIKRVIFRISTIFH